VLAAALAAADAAAEVDSELVLLLEHAARSDAERSIGTTRRDLRIRTFLP
jgi:hypothetical protein